MLIVPLTGDTIKIADTDTTYKVVNYTNYKENGPAVYVKTKSKEVVLVYFIDIEEVNGVKVEYQRGSKVFKAFGKINRKLHLPQPDDKLIILTDKKDDDQESKEKVEVAGLKLKSKSSNVHKGLLVKDTDGNYYRLKQILDIDRALGGDRFDRDEFLNLYEDYKGA